MEEDLHIITAPEQLNAWSLRMQRHDWNRQLRDDLATRFYCDGYWDVTGLVETYRNIAHVILDSSNPLRTTCEYINGIKAIEEILKSLGINADEIAI